MNARISPLVLSVDARLRSRPQQHDSLCAEAQADYQRLRHAYAKVARDEPGHEVAFAMIGADMDRAYARLQMLLGRPAPVTDASPVDRRLPHR